MALCTHPLDWKSSSLNTVPEIAFKGTPSTEAKSDDDSTISNIPGKYRHFGHTAQPVSLGSYTIDDAYEDKFSGLVQGDHDQGWGRTSGTIDMVVDTERLSVMPGVELENEVVQWPVDAREFLTLPPISDR